MRKIIVKIGKPKPINANIEEPKDVEAVLRDVTLRQTSGATNHDELDGRDLPNQHPMSSIEGLELALGEKQPAGDYVTEKELNGRGFAKQTDVSQLSKEIDDLKQNTPSSESALTIAQVEALDGMFKKCAFTGDVTAEYNAFKVAFGIESGNEEPDTPVEPDEPTTPTLTSISAVYTGGDVTEGTALTDLTGITVTAHYSDGSTATVTGYTLSGEIVEGSNTITVSYGGKTTTFTVTGVAESGGDEPTVYTLAEYASVIHENTKANEAAYYDAGMEGAGGYGKNAGYTCYVLENVKAGDQIKIVVGNVNLATASANVKAAHITTGYESGNGYLFPDFTASRVEHDNYAWMETTLTFNSDCEKVYIAHYPVNAEGALAYVPTLTRA